MKKIVIFLLAILIASALPQTTNAQKQKTLKIKIGEKLESVVGHSARFYTISSDQKQNCHPLPMMCGSKIEVVDMTSKSVVVYMFDGQSSYEKYCAKGTLYQIEKMEFLKFKIQATISGSREYHRLTKQKRMQINNELMYQKAAEQNDQKILDKYRNK